MKKNTVLKEMFNSEDPAGSIPERELQNLADASGLAGGQQDASVVVTTTIAISIALCPTTKCTSQCC